MLVMDSSWFSLRGRVEMLGKAVCVGLCLDPIFSPLGGDYFVGSGVLEKKGVVWVEERWVVHCALQALVLGSLHARHMLPRLSL